MMRLKPTTVFRLHKVGSSRSAAADLSLSTSSSSSASSLFLRAKGIQQQQQQQYGRCCVIRLSSSSFSTSSSSSSSTESNTKKKRSLKSLALCTYFKHPDFDMKDYEILSRASAFLLAVDPKDTAGKDDPYGHLERAELDRKIREFQRENKYTPASGGGPDIMDMGWLEFVPKEHRPNVHLMCSSHVVSPFLWKDYYPQDWLSKVRQEHCTYSVELFDSDNPNEAIGKFALHNTPIHHPEGRDLSLMHLKDEESALDLMKKQGVEVLYLKDSKKLYEKGQEIYFDGFEVSDTDIANQEHYNNYSDSDSSDSDEEDEDARVFMSYKEHGTLSFHTNDRFFATTPKPLPEGLCGAPAIDRKDDNSVCGIVEGIVPVTHENKQLAGCAAFIPSYILKSFIDFGERFMVEQMMPKDLFQNVVRAKATNSIGGGVFKMKQDQQAGGNNEAASWEEAYERQMELLKKKYSKEEVDAILWNLNREREEVMELMDQGEGGDMDDVIEKVRAKTLKTREMVIDAYKKGELNPLHDASEQGTGKDDEEKKVP